MTFSRSPMWLVGSHARGRASILGVCFGLLAACQSEPKVPEAASPSSAALSAAKPAEAPAPVVDDTSFHLSLKGQPTYTSGQAGTVQLVLEPRGGYHVNQDYPIRVDLKAPAAVKLSKGSLTKEDAVQIAEAGASFDVSFSAEPGTHELLATVDFAVCTKETCVPDQRTLAVALKVQ
jgi:hypothetical protein